MAIINQEAPQLLNYLDPDSTKHFSELKKLLRSLEIPFIINPRLVRGLDYYNKTVFEWIIRDASGAQNTVCGGGRYDGLIKHLQGPDKAAVGFAIGLERLLELWMSTQAMTPATLGPQIYLIKHGEATTLEACILAEKLRSTLPQLKLQVDHTGGHFSQQFKRASESQATIALVLGENEIKTEKITVKPLQNQQPQRQLTWTELVEYLQHNVTTLY